MPQLATPTRRHSLSPELRAAALLIIVLASCAPPAEQPAPPAATTPSTAAARATTAVLAVATGTPSAQPRLAVGPSGTWLSWLEPTGSAVDGEAPSTHALRLAHLEGAQWSTPTTVIQRDDLFVNWADFPSVIELAGGELLAHFLQKRAGGKYAYDVRYALSADRGATWSEAQRLHDDDTATEHGFVSVVGLADGRAAAVWLDGRAMADGDAHGDDADDEGHGATGDMSLRLAVIEPTGAITASGVLDDRVCECCGTAAVVVGDTVHVLYRDRSPSEVRDIHHGRVRIGTDGNVALAATEPFHADDWTIRGCPVNGPAAAVDGDRMAVAWFTMAGDAPRVQLKLSSDGGDTFAAPHQVSGAAALGRVDVALDDRGAVVVWLEDGSDQGAIWARRYRFDGTAGDAAMVTAVSSARSSGFPRLVHASGRLILAWTDPADSKQVRTAVLGGV